MGPPTVTVLTLPSPYKLKQAFVRVLNAWMHTDRTVGAYYGLSADIAIYTLTLYFTFS